MYKLYGQMMSMGAWVIIVVEWPTKSEMWSNRFRKLLIGFKHWLNGEDLEYQVPISTGKTSVVQFEVWNQEKLQAIEGGPELKVIIEDLQECLELPSEMLGKRSGEILVSKSKRFCMKRIEDEDVHTFEEMMEHYLTFKGQGNLSLLVPIYAIFRLHSSTPGRKKESTDNYAVMPNLREKEPIVFDIKGHCDNRFIDEADFKIFRFGKDENFFKSELRTLLSLIPMARREAFLARFKQNLAFLRAHSIIDYSLLYIYTQSNEGQGAHDDSSVRLNDKWSLEWRIIDFMQVYNDRKKMENRFKSFFFKQVSSVDPQTYADRLLNFVERSLLSE